MWDTISFSFLSHTPNFFLSATQFSKCFSFGVWKKYTHSFDCRILGPYPIQKSFVLRVPVASFTC
jgi:hypothetical protein